MTHLKCHLLCCQKNSIVIIELIMIDNLSRMLNVLISRYIIVIITCKRIIYSKHEVKVSISKIYRKFVSMIQLCKIMYCRRIYYPLWCNFSMCFADTFTKSHWTTCHNLPKACVKTLINWNNNWSRKLTSHIMLSIQED